MEQYSKGRILSHILCRLQRLRLLLHTLYLKQRPLTFRSNLCTALGSAGAGAGAGAAAGGVS